MTQTGADTQARSTDAATGRRRAGGGAPADGDVHAAVMRDLAEIAKVAPKLAKSALAATALALAKEIDSDKNSATSKAMCSREIREALNRLLERCPPTQTDDNIDQLGSRAAAKLGR